MEALMRNYFFVGSLPLQALAYTSAGVIGTMVHYAILVILLQGIVSDIVVASTLGAILGGLVNYWLAHRRVFKSQVRHQVALPKFVVVASIGIGINAAVLAAIAKPLSSIAGQLLASIVVLMFGFVLNRTWSFRE